jgi:hypothetical protein
MITTPDGVVIYTEQDMQELRAELTHVANQKYEDGKGNMHRILRGEALDWFKGEVRSGTMSKDDAVGIFNGLAGALGWTEVESIATLFTVTVDYNGETIAEFSDIEADDEDSAVEEVEGNLEVEDVEISFQIAYNGLTRSGTTNYTYEFDSGEFEFTATEQQD